MDYNSISSFLEKFKKIIFQKEEIKETVVKIISETILHQIKKESVKIKGTSIYVEGSPILRSEIMIHKKQILVKIKNLLPYNNFLDIK